MNATTSKHDLATVKGLEAAGFKPYETAVTPRDMHPADVVLVTAQGTFTAGTTGRRKQHVRSGMTVADAVQAYRDNGISHDVKADLSWHMIERAKQRKTPTKAVAVWYSIPAQQAYDKAHKANA